MEKMRRKFLLYLLLFTTGIPAVFYAGLGCGLEPNTVAFAAAFAAAFAVAVAAVAAAATAAFAVAFAATAAAVVVAATAAADEMKCKWWRVVSLVLLEAATIFGAEFLYTLPEICWWAVLVVPIGMAGEYGLWRLLLRPQVRN